LDWAQPVVSTSLKNLPSEARTDRALAWESPDIPFYTGI